MHAIAIVLSAIAALVSAQDGVSLPSNPNTQYLTETDSNGVITGMPTVATSQPAQPAVVTSQPDVVTAQSAPASLPILGDGETTILFNNHTYTLSVNGTSTSFITSTSTSANPASGASGSGSSGNSTSTSKGAGATGKAAAGMLIGAAGLVAALL